MMLKTTINMSKISTVTTGQVGEEHLKERNVGGRGDLHQVRRGVLENGQVETSAVHTLFRGLPRLNETSELLIE